MGVLSWGRKGRGERGGFYITFLVHKRVRNWFTGHSSMPLSFRGRSSIDTKISFAVGCSSPNAFKPFVSRDNILSEALISIATSASPSKGIHWFMQEKGRKTEVLLQIFSENLKWHFRFSTFWETSPCTSLEGRTAHYLLRASMNRSSRSSISRRGMTKPAARASAMGRV